jgi:hypothetical protein
MTVSEAVFDESLELPQRTLRSSCLNTPHFWLVRKAIESDMSTIRLHEPNPPLPLRQSPIKSTMKGGIN